MYVLVYHVLLFVLFEVCQSRNHFIVGFMENSADLKALAIYVGVADQNISSVSSIKINAVNPILNSEYFLESMDATLMDIPGEYKVMGAAKSGQGISIWSDQELFIVGINRVIPGSSTYMSGFLGIPVASLGSSYYAVTESRKAEILIVGVHNGTTVHVTSAKQFRYNKKNTNYITETINEFETLQVQEGINSLTGTHIRSDKAVSVYSGNDYFEDGRSSNHLVQQLAPVGVWGSTHITVPPHHTHYTVILVTASADTIVSSSCGHTFKLPDIGSSSSQDMGDEHCVLKSNNPVSVTMIVRSSTSVAINPTMIRIQPFNPVQHLVFFVTNQTKLTRLILVSDVDDILLDAASLPLLRIQDTPFYSSQLPVVPGRHIVSCDPGCSISAYVHGHNGVEAMGYPLISRQVKYNQTTGGNRNTHKATQPSSIPSTVTAGETATISSAEPSSPPSTETSNLNSHPRTYVPTVSSTTGPSMNTGSTSVSEQTDTTQVPRGNTPTNVPNLICTCRNHSFVATNYSQEELDGLVAELRRKLLVKRQDTTKYTRTLTSAADHRTSSMVVGYLAGTLLVTMVAGLLIIDSPNIWRMLKTIKRNLSSP